MPEPVAGSSTSSLYAVSGTLGDPDDALLTVTRRPAIWASVYGVWAGRRRLLRRWRISPHPDFRCRGRRGVPAQRSIRSSCAARSSTSSRTRSTLALGAAASRSRSLRTAERPRRGGCSRAPLSSSTAGSSSTGAPRGTHDRPRHLLRAPVAERSPAPASLTRTRHPCRVWRQCASALDRPSVGRLAAGERQRARGWLTPCKSGAPWQTRSDLRAWPSCTPSADYWAIRTTRSFASPDALFSG